MKKDTVSIGVVVIVAFVVPVILIGLLSLLIPSSTIAASTGSRSTASPWRRRLWELHAGWLGLVLSLAGAFFVTSGLKDVVGKPRPDLIARCEPDLSNIAANVVGGLGEKLNGAPLLVSSKICQASAQRVKNGFAAFPSGHSSFSWAGLFYLSLWLGAKFACTFPVSSIPFYYTLLGKRTDRGLDLRSTAAAPPLTLLVIVAFPTGLAIYICGTRYADYMHAGWDIMAGSIIGAVFAWIGFRWYHIPVSNGLPSGQAGWSWAPRSRAAFGVGFGGPGFAEVPAAPEDDNLELGYMREGASRRREL